MYANREDPGITFRKAAEFGISRRAASEMRKRFLRPHLARLMLSTSDVAHLFAKEIVDEIRFLEAREGVEFTPERRSAERITDEMVERARMTPITHVVHFNREKRAQAWCHEDKRPSLYHMTRTNKVCCPVCNKTFDTIKVLMERDGYTFIDAVKALN